MVYGLSQDIKIYQVFINIIFLKTFFRRMLPNYSSPNQLPSIPAAQLSSWDHPLPSPRWFLLPLSHVGSQFLHSICLPHSFWWSVSFSRFYFIFQYAFLSQMVPSDLPPPWVSRQTKIPALLCALVCRLLRSSFQISFPGNWQAPIPFILILLSSFTGNSQWWRGLGLSQTTQGSDLGSDIYSQFIDPR